MPYYLFRTIKGKTFNSKISYKNKNEAAFQCNQLALKYFKNMLLTSEKKNYKMERCSSGYRVFSDTVDLVIFGYFYKIT